MNKNLFIIFIFFYTNTFAQEYKPFKIKSGKIEYELRKYKTHSHYTNENGEKSKWKEDVPYVAEIINYYWDDYGDVAFEESWKVVDFSKNPIPKIKKYEMLWADGHHYYYNFEEHSLRDDPDNIRQECLDRFQFYQITDSWVKATYGGVEKGRVKILGREAIYYQANESLDIYTWKGLPLKKETFNTSGEGKRLKIESTRLATDIKTGIKFNSMMFDPIRMNQNNDFTELNMDDIGGMFDGDPDKLRQIGNSGYEIREGDVILYVTSDYRMGKLRVLRIKKEEMDIQFVTYDSVGSVFNQSSDLCIRNHYTCDLDCGTTSENRMYQQDFRYKFRGTPMLIPFPNYGFYLIKASRK